MRILYEDKDIICVEKPIGVPVQPDPSKDKDLLTLAAEACGCKTLYLVHRLDRAVGGAVLFSKNARSAAKWSAAFAERRVEKIYYLVCVGTPEKSGEMRDFIRKESAASKAFITRGAHGGAKEGHLFYETLATGEDAGAPCALVRVRLTTGRFHQIRVQFASRGMPLFGDGKYGSRKKGCKTALYAAALVGENITVKALPPLAEYPWNLFEKDVYEI
ncbi:MAG: RluA family pseudouridine synthase [Clostridia bacterium]|nr:RluA family pseudouridine synthase [Clostridia bacterium]